MRSLYKKIFKLTWFCKFSDWPSAWTLGALESSTNICNLPHNSEYAIINVRRQKFPWLGGSLWAEPGVESDSAPFLAKSRHNGTSAAL